MRPPWKVPGVDYHVGIDRSKYPTNTNLVPAAQYASANPMLCSINNSSFYVKTGETVEGVDFSGNGGYTVRLQGPGSTLKNCYIKVGTNKVIPVRLDGSSGPVTVTQCEIDGSKIISDSNGTDNDALVEYVDNVTYCVLMNANSDVFNAGKNINYKFNLIGPSNGGGAGAHPDWVQTGGGAGWVYEISYNLFFQDGVTNLPQSSQGIGIFSNNITGAHGNCSNNVIIAKPNGFINYGISIDPSVVDGPTFIKNNYFDFSGFGCFRFWASNANESFSGNTDMNNGKIIASDNSES